MSLLSASQQAKIKATRAEAWTRAFDVVTSPGPTGGAGYYAEPAGSESTQVLSGDWVWQDELRRRGSPGGPIATADVLLSTDIAHSGVLLAPTARLRIDGLLCAKTALTSYPDSGEIVVAAVRVK